LLNFELYRYANQMNLFLEISGIAEQIWAKFTRKMYLVHEVFEGHHGQKTAFFNPFGGLCAVCVW